MRLSWNEIRARAAVFAEEWKDEGYERGEAQTFYNDFFQIFGVTRRRVASFEEPVKKLGDKRGRIDLFWKGKLLIEAKSAGADRVKAKAQALDYFPGLKEHELPRYVLVCDFQNFDLYDLEEDTEVHFTLATLPDHVQAFGFVLGIEKVTFRDQDPVNIQASELMGELHDALRESGYTGHDLERFLVRILFCLFADDASIFEPRGVLQELLTQRTAEDGSDTGRLLSELFEVLNTPEKERQKNLDEDLKKFPYVNGDLFKERLRIPQFDRPMREALLEAADFNWEKVSPAIFGSLFQSVMDRKERRAQGAHYTTEKNILKVIQPLFLDELHEEFARLKALRGRDRRSRIEAFHDRLSKLRFFDPACGCGNFLIIAYRELRELEIEILKELNPKGQRELDVAVLSKIDVDQFYGIELGEFPARIAEVAMWMMDHIMNNRLSLAFGQNYARIPLKTSPHIHCADALETDWAKVLPPEECSYVFGNPPFSGKKEQSLAQKQQVRRIFENITGSGELDYVACWFRLSCDYMAKNVDIKTALVATKSVTQGEQVAVLWDRIINRDKCQIEFAHRTFEWSSEARGKAHVHVVIIALAKNPPNKPRRIYDYAHVRGEPTIVSASNINPYLIDGPNIFVRKASRPLTRRPVISKGSEATDFGFLTLTPDQARDLIKLPGFDRSWIRPFIGGDEYINKGERYCLWLVNANPTRLKEFPAVRQRVQMVAQKRKESDKPRTRKWAEMPTLFSENRQPSQEYLLIPKVSSQTREYVPMGFMGPDVIVSGSAQFIEGAGRSVLGILTSAMHMSWMRAVGGRTKSDYQYTNTLVYNTFPWPEMSSVQEEKIAELAEVILAARAEFPESTLAELYDPDFMPPNLHKAHRDLDLAVDRLYRAKPFEGDRDRVEHLFGLYEKLVAPLAVAAKPARKPRGKVRA